MARPNRGDDFGCTGIFKPREAAECVVRRHLAVAFSGSATVTAYEGIAIAVAVDIGQDNAGYSVGCQAANWVMNPSAIFILWLF